MNTQVSNGGGTKSFLQFAQTVLVALLLGISGWIGTTTIHNREEIVKLQAEATLLHTWMESQKETQENVLSVLKTIREDIKKKYEIDSNH